MNTNGRGPVKRREVNIKRLQVTLPRTQAGRQDDGRTLAAGVAEALAIALRTDGLDVNARNLPSVQVRIPRGRASATGIARAIQASIARTARKER
jgi:hypothetical protein